MEEIQFTRDGNKGAFRAMDNEEQIGEMVVGLDGSNLTVYHTEVSDKREGQGLAKKMFHTMVDHARKEHLRIIPLCSFVQAQLKRNPAAYSDVWGHD